MFTNFNNFEIRVKTVSFTFVMEDESEVISEQQRN